MIKYFLLTCLFCVGCFDAKAEYNEDCEATEVFEDISKFDDNWRICDAYDTLTDLQLKEIKDKIDVIGSVSNVYAGFGRCSVAVHSAYREAGLFTGPLLGSVLAVVDCDDAINIKKGDIVWVKGNTTECGSVISIRDVERVLVWPRKCLDIKRGE